MLSYLLVNINETFRNLVQCCFTTIREVCRSVVVNNLSNVEMKNEIFRPGDWSH